MDLPGVVSFGQAAGRSALETRSAFTVIWLVSMSLAGSEKMFASPHFLQHYTGSTGIVLESQDWDILCSDLHALESMACHKLHWQEACL